MPISLQGIDRAEALAALHNAAIPSVLHRGYSDMPIDTEEARKYLSRDGSMLTYVNGRALFVNLSGETLDPSDYDYHQRMPGLAAKTLAPLVAKAAGLGAATSQGDRDFARDLFPSGVPEANA
jgi:hypothetical protein